MPKDRNIAINFALFKFNKMTSLKIYVSAITEIIEMSNLDIGKRHLKGSIRDHYLIITWIWLIFLSGQSTQLLDRSPWGTSLLGVVTSLPFGHMTLINLYISSYKVVTGATSYTQIFKSSSTSCFKYFVIIKFRKFFKKQKCCRGSWTACRIFYLYLKQIN